MSEMARMDNGEDSATEIEEFDISFHFLGAERKEVRVSYGEFLEARSGDLWVGVNSRFGRAGSELNIGDTSVIGFAENAVLLGYDTMLSSIQRAGSNVTSVRIDVNTYRINGEAVRIPFQYNDEKESVYESAILYPERMVVFIKGEPAWNSLYRMRFFNMLQEVERQIESVEREYEAHQAALEKKQQFDMENDGKQIDIDSQEQKLEFNYDIAKKCGVGGKDAYLDLFTDKVYKDIILFEVSDGRTFCMTKVDLARQTSLEYAKVRLATRDRILRGPTARLARLHTGEFLLGAPFLNSIIVKDEEKVGESPYRLTIRRSNRVYGLRSFGSTAVDLGDQHILIPVALESSTKYRQFNVLPVIAHYRTRQHEENTPHLPLPANLGDVIDAPVEPHPFDLEDAPAAPPAFEFHQFDVDDPPAPPPPSQEVVPVEEEEDIAVAQPVHRRRRAQLQMMSQGRTLAFDSEEEEEEEEKEREEKEQEGGGMSGFRRFRDDNNDNRPPPSQRRRF